MVALKPLFVLRRTKPGYVVYSFHVNDKHWEMYAFFVSLVLLDTSEHPESLKNSSETSFKRKPVTKWFSFLLCLLGFPNYQILRQFSSVDLPVLHLPPYWHIKDLLHSFLFWTLRLPANIILCTELGSCSYGVLVAFNWKNTFHQSISNITDGADG